MLSFVVRNHAIAAVQKPLPRLRDGWALLRVRLAGICNTDIEILRGYHGFRGTPGHEFVGKVVDTQGISRRIRTNWMGRRVVGEINISCVALGFSKRCQYCRRGMKTHCTRRRVLGILGQDGAFAQFLTLPLENLHVVPHSVSDEQAVFVEPLAAACEILGQVKVSKFEKAAVLGDGKLALLISRVLISTGLPVVQFGKHANKLAIARRGGIATRLVRNEGNDFRHDSDRQTFPLVVEATGSPDGLASAIAMTEPRGTLILKSTFHGAAPIETWPVVVKEITVQGSRCGPFRKALQLLQAGKIDPRPLISRTFPLREAGEAMRFAERRGVLKVLLKP